MGLFNLIVSATGDSMRPPGWARSLEANDSWDDGDLFLTSVFHGIWPVTIMHVCRS